MISNMINQLLSIFAVFGILMVSFILLSMCGKLCYTKQVSRRQAKRYCLPTKTKRCSKNLMTEKFCVRQLADHQFFQQVFHKKLTSEAYISGYFEEFLLYYLTLCNQIDVTYKLDRAFVEQLSEDTHIVLKNAYN